MSLLCVAHADLFWVIELLPSQHAGYCTSEWRCKSLRFLGSSTFKATSIRTSRCCGAHADLYWVIQFLPTKHYEHVLVHVNQINFILKFIKFFFLKFSECFSEFWRCDKPYRLRMRSDRTFCSASSPLSTACSNVSLYWNIFLAWFLRCVVLSIRLSWMFVDKWLLISTFSCNRLSQVYTSSSPLIFPSLFLHTHNVLYAEGLVSRSDVI